MDAAQRAYTRVSKRESVTLFISNLVSLIGSHGKCWGYDPKQLADGGTVDKLSLYLTLRGGEDERVGKELRIMMEGMAW
jgi:hypothetical protein